LIARSGTNDVTISLIGCAVHTQSMDRGIEEAENYWNLNM